MPRADPVGHDPMPTMGEVLRDARYRRGVSLPQVEEDTLIRKKYLIALEEDDYTQLPAPVYARGFLQIYAEYLGLDPDFALKLFAPPERVAALERLRPAATGLRDGRSVSLQAVLTLAVVLLGALAILYLYGQYLAFTSVPVETVTVPRATVPVTRTVQVPVVATSPPPTATATVLPSITPTPVLGVEVVVMVMDRTWLRVVGDGQIPPVFEGELRAGETRTWKARDRIDMRVGNAGGVEVIVNGMRQGKLGANGEVKNVTWGRQ